MEPESASPNRGARWSPAADEELRRRAARNQPLVRIARDMGRTIESVRSRAHKLRIAMKSRARPWRTIQRLKS